MSKPRLLDLFCGAGGAAMGYARAGFEVVGVDIKPQPRYPFEFERGDALEFMDWFCGDEPSFSCEGCDCCHGHRRFDAIHASPPCQAWTAYRRTGNVGDYPEEIEPLRVQLDETGLPWVIENVVGAPLKGPILLCGSMFDPPMDIQRHRCFEASFPLAGTPWPCRHRVWGPDRFPGGRSVERTGSNKGKVRGTIEIGSWDIPLKRQQEAMGIDWMTLEELSEAIPPAYTEHIGHYLLKEIEARRKAAA